MTTVYTELGDIHFSPCRSNPGGMIARFGDCDRFVALSPRSRADQEQCPGAWYWEVTDEGSSDGYVADTREQAIREAVAAARERGFLEYLPGGSRGRSPSKQAIYTPGRRCGFAGAPMSEGDRAKIEAIRAQWSGGGDAAPSSGSAQGFGQKPK